MQAGGRAPWHILLGIWAAALALRLPVAVHVASGLTPRQIENDLHWDSRDYLHLARNLASTGSYEGNPADSVERRTSAHYALLRTPGYPAILATCMRAGLGIGAILGLQAVVLSLVPPLVALWMHWMCGRNRLSAMAGLLAAISPTGIGLGGMILVDGVFGVAVALAMVLMWRAATRRSAWAAAACGAALAAGVLIKPTLLCFPLLLPIAWAMAARGAGVRVKWLHMAIATALPLLATGVWCWRNQQQAGRWMYSSITAQNLRHFMALQTELGASGRALSAAEVETAQWQLRRRDWEDLQSGRLTPAQIAERQTSESMAIIRAHPFLAARGCVTSAADNLVSHWAFFRNQYPDPADASLPRDVHGSAPRWVGLFYTGLAMMHCFLPLRLILLGLAVVPVVAAWRRRREPAMRRQLAMAGALWLIVLYFVAMASTSFSVGFRVLYPAEAMLIVLSVWGAGMLATRSAQRVMR